MVLEPERNRNRHFSKVGTGIGTVKNSYGSTTLVRRGSLGFGVAQQDVALLIRVRRGSHASDCCKAGPSSNPGSAPQRRPSTERKQWGDQKWYSTSSINKILYVCLINASMPPNHFNVWHLSVPSGCRLLTVSFLYLVFLRYLCWWGAGPLGKMWVQRRLLEVSFTLTWPGSKGFTSARPGRSINLRIMIICTRVYITCSYVQIVKFFEARCVMTAPSVTTFTLEIISY